MDWISVTERLPILESDDFTHYESAEIIVFDGVGVFVSEYYAGREPKFWGNFANDNITHWVPLPLPHPLHQEE